MVSDRAAARAPRLPRRGIAWAIVIVFHVIGVGALVSATKSPVSAREPAMLYARIITTRVTNRDDTLAVSAPSVVLSDANPMWLQIPTASIPLATTYRLGIGMAAPILDPSVTVDIKEFARLAGLLPGESASVVLRIEVLADGTPGQVAVETSGGSDHVDAAAVAYGRALRWLSGTVNGVPEDIWVRWGVTLAA